MFYLLHDSPRHVTIQLLLTGVAVEKLDISEIREDLGDRKCLTEQRKSFVEHPDAL
jgi:hypothetical protein